MSDEKEFKVQIFSGAARQDQMVVPGAYHAHRLHGATSDEERESNATSSEESEQDQKIGPLSQRRGVCHSRHPLVVSGLMVIIAVVGAVLAWHWLKEQSDDSAASPSPENGANSKPTPDDMDHPSGESPFGSNRAPIPPPLNLYTDLGETSSQPNDDCPVQCNEEHYAAVVDHLYDRLAPNLQYLQTLVVEAWWMQLAAPTARSNAASRTKGLLKDIATKLGRLADSLTKADIGDFYAHFISRQMYAMLGAETIVRVYSWFDTMVRICVDRNYKNTICPVFSDQIDEATATQYLLDHADNTFSSICSAGHPFPWWSEPDGSGYIFQPNSETGKTYPVSGSGINMSAPLDSLTHYFTLRIQELEQDPTSSIDTMSREWIEMVETNPLYAWFMAGLTPAKEGTICSNEGLTGSNTGDSAIDRMSAEVAAGNSYHWCTKSEIPNATYAGTGNYTKQHFARMWYKMLWREYSSSFPHFESVFEENEKLRECCGPVLTKYKKDPSK